MLPTHCTRAFLPAGIPLTMVASRGCRRNFLSFISTERLRVPPLPTPYSGTCRARSLPRVVDRILLSGQTLQYNIYLSTLSGVRTGGCKGTFLRLYSPRLTTIAGLLPFSIRSRCRTTGDIVSLLPRRGPSTDILRYTYHARITTNKRCLSPACSHWQNLDSALAHCTCFLLKYQGAFIRRRLLHQLPARMLLCILCAALCVWLCVTKQHIQHDVAHYWIPTYSPVNTNISSGGGGGTGRIAVRMKLIPPL